MIFAITNAKGGVGKTTVAVHLLVWLHLHSCKVVLVDCDAQRLSSRWLKIACPELAVITLDSPQDIQKELTKLGGKYDAVIVDAPGGLGEKTVAILSQVDAAIIPTSGSYLDVMGLSWTIDTIYAMQSERDGKPITVVLPVKADRRLKTTKNLKNKAKRLGFGVTRTTLAPREIYAQTAGLETDDGEGWLISPSVLWNLGRNKTVRDAALELDSAFKEILPEACVDNPDLIRDLVTPKSKMKLITGKEDAKKLTANS